jgi:hypothetical protein
MTLAETPLAAAVAFVIADAIAYREPDRRGCCEDGEPCGDHEADQARADAMGVLLTAVEDADGDDAALEALRGVPADVLAEVTGTTWDQELAAAITGGADGGQEYERR